MSNQRILNFVNFKSLCNSIAIFGAIFAVVSALAPDTLAQMFNMPNKTISSPNWVSEGRVTWITVGSISLLASWGRFIEEVYAQKVLMKFFSVIFGSFAISNILNGIEGSAVVHPISLASIAGLGVLSWFCWANGRGIEPNIKQLSANQKVSVFPTEESQKASG